MAETKSSLVRDFDKKSTSFFSPKYIIVLIVLALLGVGTGYGLAKKSSGPTINTISTGTESTSKAIQKGAVVGSNDTNTFKDMVEGTVQQGGIEGEGQFHLVRPGGDSQNVYLTSSTVDLSQYIGKKVKIWGATQSAQHAGWLMDVGKLEVLE